MPQSASATQWINGSPQLMSHFGKEQSRTRIGAQDATSKSTEGTVGGGTVVLPLGPWPTTSNLATRTASSCFRVLSFALLLLGRPTTIGSCRCGS